MEKRIGLVSGSSRFVGWRRDNVSFFMFFLIGGSFVFLRRVHEIFFTNELNVSVFLTLELRWKTSWSQIGFKLLNEVWTLIEIGQ